jgi:hypothetical protein
MKIITVLLLLVCACGPGLAGETATLRNGFTIHYERRETLNETTRLFLTESAESFVDVPSADIVEIEADKVPATTAPARRPAAHQPVRLDEALSAASRKNNLSPELLRSVVRVESGFNANARSAKGAQGLMQLMPATAAQMGVRDVFNPEQNLDGGARYLHELLGRYHDDLTLALAAYNAGPERVERYHGVPPFPETVTYVTRVLQNLDLAQLNGARSFAHTPQFKPSLKRSGAPNLDAVREFQLSVAADGSR